MPVGSKTYEGEKDAELLVVFVVSFADAVIVAAIACVGIYLLRRRA